MSQVIQKIRENLDFEIKRRNLKPQEVEKKAGLTKGVLYNFCTEKSNNPTFMTIYEASRVLGCSIEELMGLPTPSNDQNPNLKIIWNKKTFLKIIDYIDDFFKQNGYEVFFEDVLEIAKDVYQYSLNNSKDKQVDYQFADWLLRKNL